MQEKKGPALGNTTNSVNIANLPLNVAHFHSMSWLTDLNAAVALSSARIKSLYSHLNMNSKFIKVCEENIQKLTEKVSFFTLPQIVNHTA